MKAIYKSTSLMTYDWAEVKTGFNMECLKHCTKFKSDFFGGKCSAEKWLGCAQWRLKVKKQTNKKTPTNKTKHSVQPMEIIFIIIVIILIIITVN